MQRSSTSGRPTGTDGSDFSFRMVVDSRYQKVAKGKSRLRSLIMIQAVLQLIGALHLILSISRGDVPDPLAISSIAAGFFSLVLAELGRSQSLVSFFKVSIYTSIVAIILGAACIAKGDLTIEDVQSMQSWGTKKLEILEVAHIVLGSLMQVFTIKTVLTLLSNMSPPKKAS